MSGIATGWAVNTDFFPQISPRLAFALGISLAAHLLLLTWPVHVPSTGAPESDRVGALRFRLALKPAEAEKVVVPEPVVREPVVPEPVVPEPTFPAPPAVTAQEKEKPLPANEPAPLPRQKAEVPGDADSLALMGYFPVSRLSRMPEAIGTFDIHAPAGGDTGLGGKMTIRVWVSAKGDIDRLRVLGSGLPEDYAQAAVAAFGKLRFEPGEIDGVRVASWADIVIEYADFQREPPLTGAERGLAR